MTAEDPPTTTAEDQGLVITRVFDAPRELVWRAWTEPEMFMKWWGPNDFTCPHCEIDLRVGGRYLTVMRGPAGTDFDRDFWSTGVYREIVPMERLVCTDSFADEHGNVVPATHYGMEEDIPLELLVTVTFEDEGGKTRMTLRHVGFPVGQHRNEANDGWSQSFDKLAAALAAA